MLLQVQQVTRRFGADTLFDNVSLDVPEHGRVALVGRNGAGKSTLIRMITGIDAPDEGQIIYKKGMTMGYLAQDTGLDSDKSIWEEMASVFKDLQDQEEELHRMEERMSDPEVINDQQAFDQLSKTYDQRQTAFKNNNGYGYRAEIRGVLHGFEFGEEDYDRSINELSGGQKTQLALAKLLLEKRDLLVLDEPTNHLDVETLTWLEGYIQSYKGALLIVSHDRYFLDKLVSEVYEMAMGTVTHFHGNYSAYVTQKAAQLQRQWKEYDKQQHKISQLEDFVNRNIVRASTTKRAQARRKQLAKMSRIERPESDDKVAHFAFTPHRQSGNIVLTVKDLAVGYDPNKVLAKPVNIDIKKHQAIAIVGPNGVGKSTLLKTILGKIPALAGSVTFGTGVDTGYYDQEQKSLHSNKTVLAELWDDHPTTPEKDIRTILGSFLFTGEDVDKLVHSLSGGEKARLLLTKLAMKHDNFLILDEPTNHLDIDSRQVLENTLNDFDGTILFVSHDRYFINQVATSVVELSAEGSELFLGDYDYFIEKKQEQAAVAEKLQEEALEKDPSLAVKPVSQKKQSYQQSKERQKQERKLTRQVETLEQQLTDLTDQKSQIETTMTKPEIFSDQAKMATLQQQLAEITDQIETTENDWEDASLALEDLSE
ncbi:ABC-F family ATP-binding cassette domain-containing protein [Lactobacillus sp. LC28-10]|uniref:ABC-F family ATP-binding cassette domain-containing protein n=1 Tax=Secundilactobacillus angelensis TaxID=2722706 RepID=A0ABX1KX36_9LACO|nr:ABC-F family ATP-binding cassette domain-containing protein [Secundilactobacillus angelensis]MCH5462217.1 ABC-F family ATP-binding cassette domain-containing protein [Secundilactobacillus angelensis]NLR18508.1 ABC-F family ATP-binding cassette domain-containing protein [Secundilactobacillus angelensis]